METSKHIGKTARYLAQYWRHAYKIRARGLAIQPITSNKVLELITYSRWQERAWSIDFRANHGLALHQIITRNTEEISEVLEQVKEETDLEKIQELHDKAQQLHRVASAARDLLETLGE